MPANQPDHATGTDAENCGAVASRCFTLASQLAGGPVRDALLAMGRDYTAQARETAQTAGFRIELERSRSDTRGWPLRVLTDLFAPLPPPVKRVAPPAPAARTTMPAARPAAQSRQHASRMFRLHALARIES
jgi:hypothetical protein